MTSAVVSGLSTRESIDLLTHLARVLLREVLDQQRDVFATFVQRWKTDRKNIKTIVQIAAKLFLFHQLFEIAISRSHEPYIDTLGARASQPFVGVFLQRAQEFRLQLSGISPTSSRNRVPRSANSRRPARCMFAPVKAPRS